MRTKPVPVGQPKELDNGIRRHSRHVSSGRIVMKKAWAVTALVVVAAGSAFAWHFNAPPTASSPASRSAGTAAAVELLTDWNTGDDWPAYGRTYGEQHYSPLDQIAAHNVGDVGLEWFYDLPAGNPMSGPVSVKGVLYTSTGYSVVRAFDVVTGKLLWTFDPEAPEASGRKLREGWGSRGLAWWNDKIYIGTQDGRLIAINAKTGKQIWSRQTVPEDSYRFISGAPRVFDGKVIIGHGGADSSDVRGYVTTYDAETGDQLWRFYTVPGNPADGFEDETQAMAAKTWHGEWWKYGGGGTVWNTFTYDAETQSVFLGVGNGAPWNHKVRSEGKGDNLFLSSVVALDANTGRYKWHYQFNPGETWDYNASMDMQLADIVIDGRPRKVLMELPKNGFFYILDRVTGDLIAADQVAKEATWASAIDLKTGRPIENPEARLPEDGPFRLFPGPNGAHTWLPSAYSPKSGLMYLPVANMGVSISSENIGKGWQRRPGNVPDPAFNMSFDVKTRDGKAASSELVAWDPVKRKAAWRIETPGGWNGGVMATAGQLVFQGDAVGKFKAYDAATGKVLWQFDAQAPVLAPPISYRYKGKQYVTVLAGIGTSAGVTSRWLPKLYNYRTQPRRVLTFALGGTVQLPAFEPSAIEPIEDPEYTADEQRANSGAIVYAVRCLACHGAEAIAGGTGPDLRTSGTITSHEVFDQVVRQGVLIPAGMPKWEEMTDAELTDLRQYLRSRAQDMREGKP